MTRQPSLPYASLTHPGKGSLEPRLTFERTCKAGLATQDDRRRDLLVIQTQAGLNEPRDLWSMDTPNTSNQAVVGKNTPDQSVRDPANKAEELAVLSQHVGCHQQSLSPHCNTHQPTQSSSFSNHDMATCHL